jgi:hypothetical protein
VRVFAPSDESSVFTRTQTANCPSGKVPIGGGAGIDRINASFTTVPEAAVGQWEPTDTGWVVEAHEVVPTDVPWIVIAYAVCADPGVRIELMLNQEGGTTPRAHRETKR